MVTIDFLQSKRQVELPNAWDKGRKHIPSAGRGNINTLTDNVLSFVEYNLLPLGENDVIDGHYRILVNYKTFDYVVFKNSNWGSLTYVTPAKDKVVYTPETLPEVSKIRIEAIIASKLLGAYYFDFDAINSNGRNLFSTGKTEVDKSSGKTWFFDGAKHSLIADHRGYVWCNNKVNELNPQEFELCQKLDKEFLPVNVICTEVSKVKRRERNSRGWGYQVEAVVSTNKGVKELEITRVKEFSLVYTIIKDKHTGESLGGHSFTSAKSFKTVRELIPQIIISTQC
jgi:hypothetical protein